MAVAMWPSDGGMSSALSSQQRKLSSSECETTKLAQQMMAILTGGTDSRSSLSGASDDQKSSSTSTPQSAPEDEEADIKQAEKKAVEAHHEDFVLPDPDLDLLAEVANTSQPHYPMVHAGTVANMIRSTQPQAHSAAEAGKSSIFAVPAGHRTSLPSSATSAAAANSLDKPAPARQRNSFSLGHTGQNSAPSPRRVSGNFTGDRASFPGMHQVGPQTGMLGQTRRSSDQSARPTHEIAAELQAFFNGSSAPTSPSKPAVSDPVALPPAPLVPAAVAPEPSSEPWAELEAVSSDATPVHSPVTKPKVPFRSSFKGSYRSRRSSAPDVADNELVNHLISTQRLKPEPKVERRYSMAELHTSESPEAGDVDEKLPRSGSWESYGEGEDQIQSVFAESNRGIDHSSSWGDVFTSAADFPGPDEVPVSAAQGGRRGSKTPKHAVSEPNLLRHANSTPSVFDAPESDKVFGSFNGSPPRSPRSRASGCTGSESPSSSSRGVRPESPTMRGRGATEAIGLGVAMACSSYLQGARSRLSGVAEPMCEKVDVSNREAWMSLSARRALEAIPRDAEIYVLILPDRAYFPSTSRRIDRAHNKITEVLDEKCMKRGKGSRRYIVLFCESLEGWNSLTVGLCANFLPRDVVHDQFRQAMAKRFAQLSPPTVKGKKTSGEQWSKAAHFSVYQGVQGERMYIFEDIRDRSRSPSSRSISPTRPLVHMGSSRGSSRSGARENRMSSSYD